MKVAIVSSFDMDGGAARAAHRLHRSLLLENIESRMFVQVAESGEDTVTGARQGFEKAWGRIRPHIDGAPAKILGAQSGNLSLNWLPSSIVRRVNKFSPDVVHVHAIHAGCLSIAQLAKFNTPLIITAHDMWPFTGGCHYDVGCGRYESNNCRPCPIFTSELGSIASRRLRSKQRNYALSNAIFIVPSRWLQDVAKRSPASMSRGVFVIPNGIDTDRFKAIDKGSARKLFQLPADRKTILFGAMNATTDKRKGFDLLDGALARLQQRSVAKDLQLVIYGSSQIEAGTLHGIPYRAVGHLRDEESLIALYSASDLFVAPSRQDNFPNTVLEATACGVPTIAFSVGGMTDLVEDGVTGWLASDVSAEALALQMSRALEELGPSFSYHARLRAESMFSVKRYVASHVDLYERALADSPSHKRQRGIP